MKKNTKNGLLIYAISISIFFLFLMIEAKGQETVNVPAESSMIIKSENGEAKTYTESHSWGVRTTATVVESDCLKCLRVPSELNTCKNIGLCLDIKLN